MVEARREREAALERHEAEGRLEADDPAAGGRDADRAAGVGAERGVGKAGGERGGRAAARPAREAPRRDRVRHGSEVRVLRRHAVGELVQVRLADVRVARGLEAPHGLRGDGRDVVDEERRPVRRPQAGRVEEVLDRKRDPRRRLLDERDEDPVRRVDLGHRQESRSPADHRVPIAQVPVSDESIRTATPLCRV